MSLAARTTRIISVSAMQRHSATLDGVLLMSQFFFWCVVEWDFLLAHLNRAQAEPPPRELKEPAKGLDRIATARGSEAQNKNRPTREAVACGHRRPPLGRRRSRRSVGLP